MGNRTSFVLVSFVVEARTSPSLIVTGITVRVDPAHS